MLQDSERFFQYDAMNRQTVVDAVDAAGNLGSQGHRIAYDAAGNRASDTWWGHRVGAPDGLTTEQYGYDAMGRLSAIVRDGILTDERKYDAASRVVSTGPSGSLPAAYVAALNGTDWQGEALAGNGSETRINRDDANGRITRQDVFTSDNSPKATIFYDRPAPLVETLFPQVGTASGYDAVGNLRGYTVVDQKSHTVTNYANAYEATHTYRQASTLSTASHASPGATQFVYQDDALVAVKDIGEPRNDRSFFNDMEGRVLTSTQNGAVQRQLVVNGEVLGRYGQLRDDANPTNPFNGDPRFQQKAQFSFGYQPISGRYPGASPGTYAVAAGDTLKGIARGAYGDESLWYLVAEANGLSSDGDLKAGQVLTVPTRVTSANAENTFRPYDPSQAIGDTSPTALPAPQAGDGACGGFGQIIVIAVAVFVTIWTAGLAASALGATGTAGTATAGGLGTTLTTGATALGGGYGAVGAAAAAVGGAVGSIVSQGVGMAIGTQESFSWKGVALSAVSAGVTSGLGASGLLPAATGTFGNGLVRGALLNAVTQGVGVATGLQSSFSWRSVAASAIGSGVGAELSETAGLTSNGVRIEGLSFGQQLAGGTVSALGAGLTVAVLRGGRVSATQVATDAFGNALGESLAAANGQTSGIANGEQDDQLGGFIKQNQSAWEQRAAYSQIVDAFGQDPGRRYDGVQVAAGPAFRGLGSDQLILGTYDLDSEIASAKAFLNGMNKQGTAAASSAAAYGNAAWLAAQAQATSDLYASGAGDIRETVMPIGENTAEQRAFEALQAERPGDSIRALSDNESFFAFNPIGRTLSGVATGVEGMAAGVVNLGKEAVLTAGDAIGAGMYGLNNALGGRPLTYPLDSALGRSLQTQGVGPTTLNAIGGIARGLASPVTAPFGALYRQDPRAFGESLPVLAGAVAPMFRAGTVAEVAGPFSELAPGGGLAVHEAAGGHLLLKHVSQTEQQLVNRLANEPRITGSSSFYDQATAESTISQALAAKRSDINAWLATSKPTMPLEYTLPTPVGITVRQGSTTAVDTSSLRLMLRQDSTMSIGYRIHTGFPIP